MKPSLQTRLSRVALAAAAWTALAFVFTLPDLSAGRNFRNALLFQVTLWWSWGLVTPLILWVDRQISVSSKQLTRRVLAHLLPSLLVTVVFVYLVAAMRAAVGMREWQGLASIQFLADSFGGLFLWNWLNYWLILGAWQAYRLERMEKTFSEARLNALRMQLDPHFLFNALNTISSQVDRDPKLARAMIEHLGDLLRLSLESKDRQEVPLAEEMAFLEHYVAIQKIRFGDQLRIETQIAPDVKYASVPAIFVQPLVENAIRHGISRRASGGTVVVSARRDGDRLDIRVLDDGVGLPAGWTLENSGGTGLSVTRERVAGLYPEGETSFAVNRRSGGGTEVEISLPLRWNGKDGNAAVIV